MKINQILIGCSTNRKCQLYHRKCQLYQNVNYILFDTLYTKNPPQTILRRISVEHRRIELLTF